MYRIMLVVEEMNELNQLTSLLKKLGCDVDSLLSEVGLQTRVLGFNPDLIFVSGSGKKIAPINVAKKILEFNAKVKVIIQIPQGVPINPQDLTKAKIDAIVEAPTDSSHVIEIIAKVLGQDGQLWIDKLQKLGMIAQTIPVHLPTEAENKKRTAKYAQYLKGLTLAPKSTLQKSEAKKRWKALEKEWDQDELKNLDAEKRQFVKALFKK